MTVTSIGVGLRPALFALVALAVVTLATLAVWQRDSEPVAKTPPEVTVMQVTPRTTPVWVDLVAEIRALREVELRARVSGLVEKQAFQPGQDVTEGELLFVIDPRPYRAALADAKAKLADAAAQLVRAEQDVERYRPLVPENAIPKQTFDQALAAQEQAKALVDARRATLEQAELDLAHTEIRSPLTGQAGLQEIEVGGLVSAGQTPLVVVSTVDPMLVYASFPEAEFIEFSRHLQDSRAAGRTLPRDQPLELFLADGSKYPHAGRFDFADRAISATTGTLTARARFANPDRLLRPGMYGRLRVTYDTRENALLVPQKAITEMLGKQFVTIIGDGEKAEQREVRMGERVGSEWIVAEGLKGGERLVVDGLQKASPGTVVKATLVTQVLAPATDDSAGPSAPIKP